MIQTSLEPDRRRVVVRQGGRTLGEIIYQIQTNTGWCGPVEFTQTSESVAVRLVGASGAATVEARIVDRFVPSDNGLIVDRTWELQNIGEYRLMLDYRLLERELTGRVVPGLEYRRTSEIGFPALSFAAQEATVYGCVAYVGDDRCQALSVDAPGQSLFADLSCNSEMSERFPAAHYSFPATASGPTFLRVTRRDLPFLVRLRFVLLAGSRNVDELIRGLHERACATATETSLPEGVSWSGLHQARLSLIQSHISQSKRNAGITPLLPKGDAGAVDYATAVRPFWSLEAARALVGEGQDNAGLMVARFYLQGLQPDGRYCDAFDPTTGRWGSITRAGWLRGAAQFPHVAEAGMRFLNLASELHARRIEEPRLSWAATEIGEFVMRCQADSGAYANPDSDATAAGLTTPAHGAAGVSLLVRLQKIRGRNSLRSASLRRSVPYYCGVANDISLLLDSSAERDVVTELLRALIDAAESDGSKETRSSALTVAHVLLSWFFTHNVRFPQGSVAATHSVSTKGVGVVSLARCHLDFEGAPIALGFLRLYRLCSDPYFLKVARQILVSGQQLVSGVTANGRINLRRYPLGWQPAEVDHTSWSTARRRTRGRLRGSRIGQVSTTLVALKQIGAEFPEALVFPEALD